MKLGKAFLFSILVSCFVVFLSSFPLTKAFGSTSYTITFGGTSFSPSSMNVEVGDTIVWSGAFFYHRIQSTSVPSGAATFGATDQNTTALSYVVTTAGTYDYQCNLHYTMGMVGSFTATTPANKGFTLTTTTIDFGSLRAGSSLSKGDTLKSVGPDAALTISSSPLSVGTQFSNSPTTAGRSVSVGSSETELITFTPTGRGTFYDTLSINNNSTTSTDQVKKILLSGTGINGIFSGNATLPFDNVKVGGSKQLTYTITNSGDDTLFLSAPNISGTGFSIVTGSAQNIIPGGTGSVTIKYAPTVREADSGALTFTAQNNVNVPSIKVKGAGIAPVMTLLPAANYDMGLINVGGTLPGSVQVSNNGDDTLHVSAVSIPNTQQGAKFTLASTAGFIVLPAANTNISFTYTSSSESIDNATLIITSDDPSSGTRQIALTAHSGLPKMSVDTKDTIDFGSARINSATTAFLTISNTGSYNLTVQINSFTPSVFALALLNGTIPPQGNTQAVFSFTPIAEGPITGMAILKGSDNNTISDTIYFKGVGINTNLDFPSSVNFHQLNIGKTTDTVLLLKNFGTAGAKIFRYSLTDPSSGFKLLDTAAHTISANDSVAIKIRFAPSQETSYTGTVNILTDDGAAPTRQIALAGVGINSKLSTDVSVLDFGQIDTGNTVTKKFTITNTGTASTTITSVNKTGDPSFTLEPLSTPIQLDPAGSKDISITFAPQTAGTFDGTVAMTASEGSPFSVSLHGLGHITVIVNSVANVINDLGLKMMVYPNPNNGTASIKLILEKPLNINLALFDATGKMVQEYKQSSYNSGEYTLSLDSESLPSGEYYLRAISDKATAVELKVLITR